MIRLYLRLYLAIMRYHRWQLRRLNRKHTGLPMGWIEVF